MDLAAIRRDLIAEQEALDAIVTGLTPIESLPTPSVRWSVADQIGHLTYFDGAAVVAISDRDAFTVMIGELLAVVPAGDEAMDDLTLGSFRRMTADELLGTWRTHRQRLAEASLGLDEGQRVSWYGPAMGAKSFLTARLMETSARGQDIADAVGATRPATDRLVHIAQLGFLTRGWSYANRGLEPPTDPVRVELTSPSGAIWAFGHEDAKQSVTGEAMDFCLVVTQRRHVNDTSLAGYTARHRLAGDSSGFRRPSDVWTGGPDRVTSEPKPPPMGTVLVWHRLAECPRQ